MACAPGAAPIDPGGSTQAGTAAALPELGRLAHELRTPLAAIQSMADALATGHLGGLDPKHASYLASIRETARHALAVLEGILDDSGGASATKGLLTRKAIDLGTIAAEVVRSMALLAARTSVRLDAPPPSRGRHATASATDVRQMLINLISNAITHGGGGSAVQVTVGGDDGVSAWIDVTDNGPGLPPAVAAQLDVPGPLACGTEADGTPRLRLGLRLTQHLATENGGRLEIATGPQGTRARLVLQAVAGPGSS